MGSNPLFFVFAMGILFLVAGKPWGSSKCGNLLPLFFMRRLDVYIDESGDLSPYSKSNALYVVAFVLCDDPESCKNALASFDYHQRKNILSGDFVHVGPLVWNESPYKDAKRQDRQTCFYNLYLLARHAPVRYLAMTIRKQPKMDVRRSISSKLICMLESHQEYFNRYSQILLHYDCGQPFLTKALLSAFKEMSLPAVFALTKQREHPFMQVADLIGEMELLRHHCWQNQLTKSEIAFFGEKRKIKKQYLNALDRKYI